MEKGKKKVGTKKAKRAVEPVVKKKDNSQLKATIIGIAMIVAALGLGVGTYAYYQSTITGTVSGSISAWSFIVNESPTSFSADLGSLYPGVSGQISLNLSAEASDLGVNAVVSFSGQTNWPSNLRLCTDANCNSVITVGTTTISRTIAAGEYDTVVIYYDWPRGNAEAGPTTSENASVTITVQGTQIQQ